MPPHPTAARRARLLAPALGAILTFAALGAGLAACATTGTSSAGRSLDGVAWRLVELGGRPALPAPGAAVGPDVPFVRFEADSGRASGSGGCNRMSGPYTRDGDALRLGPMVATRRACADEARNRQEVEFFAALEATRRHAVSGDTLALLGADAGVLARLVAGAPE